MSIQAIHSDNAPAAVGPYSHAIAFNQVLYPAGQLGLIPESGVLAEGIEAQTRQAFENLSQICQSAHTTLANALKVTVLITDMANFSVVNRIMEELFQAPYPARTCFAVAALPKGALVEIDAIVALPQAQ